MLTTKGQKIWMFCIGLITILLGVVVVIPFKSIFTCEKIFLIEMIVKLAVVPVLILLLSIYPNKLKYIQVSGYRNQSKIVSVMSYFPVMIYLTTLIAEAIYLLARGYVISGSAPLGTLPWTLWFVGLTVFLIVILVTYAILPSIEMKLNVQEHVLFDVIVFILMICISTLFYLVSKATHDFFVLQGPTGDPYLFVLYLIGLIAFGIHLHSIKTVICEDEINICVKYNDLDATSFVSKMAEYDRAYSDIMSRFEDEFTTALEEDELEEEYEDEASEESVEEEMPTDVVEEDTTKEKPEEVVEETSEETVVKEVEDEDKDDNLFIDHNADADTTLEEIILGDEAPAEEKEETVSEEAVQKQVVVTQKVVVDQEAIDKFESLKNEAEMLEKEVEAIRIAKLEEEAAKLAEEAAKQEARMEAQRIALEKALKIKEEMEPSFKKLVSFAKGLDGVSMIENSEKKQVRFLIGKKVFLIMADTPKDYRLQFMCNPTKVVEWWNINSEIRPRTNKSDNWFKLTNKGSFTEELLFDIIQSSRDFTVDEIERIAEEKKAQRALARKQAKGNK